MTEIKQKLKGFLLKYLLRVKKIKGMFIITAAVVMINTIKKSTNFKKMKKVNTILTRPFILELFEELLGYYKNININNVA